MVTRFYTCVPKSPNIIHRLWSSFLYTNYISLNLSVCVGMGNKVLLSQKFLNCYRRKISVLSPRSPLLSPMVDWGFHCGSAGKRIHLQSGRPGFDPWVGKIPWGREWLPTQVFWPGKFHGLYSPWGHKESDPTE